tara:strand:- start:140 stop:958 length:819 start_codon:yes stop_codon:yes gene_type:complete
MIETSLCVTSYNRPHKLKEVLSSFFKTCTYDLKKLELIIVDNGSTNQDVVEFIKSYNSPCEYRFILNEKNDYPNCLRYSKIQAREMGKGDFYIDCPDDHVFVARTDWIQRSISRIKKNKSTGCINYYSYPLYRFSKPKNKMQIDESNSDFCVSFYKGYGDFHIMSKEAYRNIGEYDYKLGRRAESEYMDRSLEAGYFRNMLVYPVAICMDDGKFGEGSVGFGLIRPIEESEYKSKLLGYMRKKYPEMIPLPIHNEALIDFCLREGHIRIKNE